MPVAVLEMSSWSSPEQPSHKCELTFSKTLSLPTPSLPSFEVIYPNWVGVGTNTETSYKCIRIRPFSEALSVSLLPGVFTNTWKKSSGLFLKEKNLAGRHTKIWFSNAYKHHVSLPSHFIHLLSLKTVIDFTTKKSDTQFSHWFLFVGKILFLCLPLTHNQYGASQRPVFKLRHDKVVYKSAS